MQAWKPGEVGIGGTELGSVLDGQRREMSVGGQVSSGAERPE